MFGDCSEKTGVPLVDSKVSWKDWPSETDGYIKRADGVHCKLCPAVHKTIHFWKRHYSVHISEKTVICDMCNKLFKDDLQMKRHKQRTHLDKKMVECDDCGIKICSMNMTRHKKHMHEKKGIQYDCDICGNKYSTEVTLKVHIRKHTNPFNCVQCSKKLTTKQALEKHVKSVHEGRKYYCDICDKVFNWESGLVFHRKGHDPNFKRPDYKCKECERVFHVRSNYNLHLQTHQGGYACETCGIMLKNSECLKRHSLIHSGIKAYSCEFCNKRFACRSTLIPHLRTHTGEKPYECSFCGKKFSQRSPLVIHMRNHTGERPYKCMHCVDAFTNKTLLKSHIQNIHRNP